MSLYSDTIQVSHLSFAAIFICIGIGFYFIKKVINKEPGPGYWSLAFILNSLGFTFWSGIIPLLPWQYFLIGEIFHISGFLSLVCGVYRFTENEYKRWNAYAAGIFMAFWLVTVVMFPSHRDLSTMVLRILRSFLFLVSGMIILHKMPRKEIVGRRLAGISLVLWGVYVIVYGFIRIDALRDFIFGILVGFQVLAAFGLLAMLVDRIRMRAEENEKRVIQLEKLLPICAYCKKIRDKNNHWHVIESYIEERTSSQFSHGICPDCLKKNFPEYVSKMKVK